MKKIVLMYFWAEWCTPCKSMRLFIGKISKEVGFVVRNINADNNTLLSKEHNISSIPSCLILYESRVILRFEGIGTNNYNNNICKWLSYLVKRNI